MTGDNSIGHFHYTCLSFPALAGAAYLDFPGDLLNMQAPLSEVESPAKVPPPPSSLASPDQIAEALQLLKNAKNPLVIVGKGVSYDRAESAANALIQATGLPFLPTAMGKGVVPDTHPNCVSPARSLALQKADVILLLGARLNWMLHFGKPPRFQENVKIIQVDVEPEEFHQSVHTTVPLLGNVGKIMEQLVEASKKANFSYPAKTPWWEALNQKKESNR